MITFMEKETARIITPMVENLTGPEKLVLLAYYYDDMSYAEMTDTFHCSEGTVERILRKANEDLVMQMSEYEIENRMLLQPLSSEVIVCTLRYLFASKGYQLTWELAQSIYDASCTFVGLIPTPLKARAL